MTPEVKQLINDIEAYFEKYPKREEVTNNGKEN